MIPQYITSDYLLMLKTATPIIMSKFVHMKGDLEVFSFKEGDFISRCGITDPAHVSRVSFGIDRRPYFETVHKTNNNLRPLWIPSFEQLLDIASKASGPYENEALTILAFSNFIQNLVRKNHEFGLIFPTKEMLALVFVMETVYGSRDIWHRDYEHKLSGAWLCPK